MADPRIVVVIRKTRLEGLVEKYNTPGQAKFYIEHLGQDFSDYLREHDEYKRQLEAILSHISRSYQYVLVDRGFLSTFLFDSTDIVYVFGQDGLVANTIKYLDGQPVIGINPDPERWVGILLPYSGVDIARLKTEQILSDGSPNRITLGEVQLSNGQILHAVNDFYIGQKSHISSRYEIEYKGRRERQSSSGIIVSTGVGSTGWLKSVLSGATRISRAVMKSDADPIDDASFPWDVDYLKYAVREPYLSPFSGVDLVFGKIFADEPLKIVSGMSETGVIFSDGMEQDFLEFSSGMTATIGVSSKKAVLIKPV